MKPERNPKLNKNSGAYKLLIPSGMVKYALKWEDGQAVNYVAEYGELIVTPVDTDTSARQSKLYTNNGSNLLTIPKPIIELLLKWEDKQEVRYSVEGNVLVVSNVVSK